MSQSFHQPPRLTIFGCGYVGSAVAATALSRGWQVTAVTRNGVTATQLESRGITVVQGELGGAKWHDAISPEQDFVLNTVSSAGGGLPGYWKSYVDGTKSVLRWAQATRDATYVYTGSTSVYPQHEGETVDEESPVGGGSEASEPLLEAERLVHEGDCFARWFILRLSGIYGPGRHYLLDQLRAGVNEFPGSGAHRLNLVHRDDIVFAIMACFDAPLDVRNQTFNVAGDLAVPKNEVAAWLAKQIGVVPPRFAGDAGDPVPDRIISNHRIKHILGWRPRYPNFRDGYRVIFETEKESTS